MTQFEKDFIAHCLEGIKTILSNEDELQNAIRIFSNGKTKDPRYQLTSKIADSINWTKEEKLKFSAAVFEATACATYAMCTNTDLTTQTKDATTLLLDHYVPLLTAKTASANKLDEVIKTCSLRKAELQNKPAVDSSFDNPWFFFSTVTAGVIVVAAAAAVALNNKG
jgi:hypothetical protein